MHSACYFAQEHDLCRATCHYTSEHLGFIKPLLSPHGFVCSSGVYFPKCLSGMMECLHTWAHFSIGGPQLQNVNCHQNNFGICKCSCTNLWKILSYLIVSLHISVLNKIKFSTIPCQLCINGHASFSSNINNEIYAPKKFTNVLQCLQSLIQLHRWAGLKAQVRFQLKEVMLRVSYCLDRLFELIRSRGSQLVLFQGFNCMCIPPPCLRLNFQLGWCPIASSVRFDVEESSLSLWAKAPYLFQWKTIVLISQTILITLSLE